MKTPIIRMESGDAALSEVSLQLQPGRIELTPEDVDVEKLVRDTFESHRPAAEERNIGMAAHVGASVSTIQADRRRLDQVLNNLISTALEFTPPGGQIELGASTDAAGLNFWVKGAGLGTAPEPIGFVLEKYKQNAWGRISKHKGTGLGLVICKMIIEAHGGKIGAKSDWEKGTTLSFTIPISPKGRDFQAASQKDELAVPIDAGA